MIFRIRIGRDITKINHPTPDGAWHAVADPSDPMVICPNIVQDSVKKHMYQVFSCIDGSRIGDILAIDAVKG